MKKEYMGFPLDLEVITGQLTKAEFKGLNLWFSYDKPIAISGGTRAIIIEGGVSPTTSRHINHVKKLYSEYATLFSNDFEEKFTDILYGRLKGRWYD